MKKYNRLSVEIIDTDDVVATSSAVETEKITFVRNSGSKSPMEYDIDSSSYEF